MEIKKLLKTVRGAVVAPFQAAQVQSTASRLEIDTTSAVYQDYLTVLTTLQERMPERVELFRKMFRLNNVKALEWLQRDPLLHKWLKITREGV